MTFSFPLAAHEDREFFHLAINLKEERKRAPKEKTLPEELLTSLPPLSKVRSASREVKSKTLVRVQKSLKAVKVVCEKKFFS